MRVLVCGSREWTDRLAIRGRLTTLHAAFIEGCCLEGKTAPQITLIHGAARGADELAASVAKDLGWAIEAYPADWDTQGKKAGAMRNSEMAKAGADLVLAFSTTLNERSGTLDMVRKAISKGIPVRVYPN